MAMFQRGIISSVIAVFVFAAVAVNGAQAQFTRVNTVDRDAADYIRHQEIQSVMTGMARQLNLSGNPSGQIQDFQRYFNLYMERMTLEATRMELPRLRAAISFDLKKLGSNQQTHDQIVAHLLTNLNKMARDEAVDVIPVTLGQIRNTPSQSDGKFPAAPPYHRATRTNAMYMIGELNSQEAASVSEDGTPYPGALSVLLAAWNDANLPIEVRVSALVGIDRHAKSGSVADNQLRGEVQTAMLALLQEAQAPEGRSEGAHLWLRRSAAGILGGMKDLGNNDIVLTTLLGVVNDKESPLALRCAAAAALAPMELDGNVQPVGQAVGSLAVDAATYETQNFETQNRAYLRDYLACVEAAIGAGNPTFGEPATAITLAATSDAEKQYVTRLNELVVGLAKTVDEVDRNDDSEDPASRRISQNRKNRIMVAARELETFLKQPANAGDAANGF